jgi:hypothetical protein
VPEHDDLKLLELARAQPKDDQLQHTLNRDVTKRQDHDASGTKVQDGAILYSPFGFCRRKYLASREKPVRINAPLKL